jgi:hypothetical protein
MRQFQLCWKTFFLWIELLNSNRKWKFWVLRNSKDLLETLFSWKFEVNVNKCRKKVLSSPKETDHFWWAMISPNHPFSIRPSVRPRKYQFPQICLRKNSLCCKTRWNTAILKIKATVTSLYQWICGKF